VTNGQTDRWTDRQTESMTKNKTASLGVEGDQYSQSYTATL